MIEEKDESDNSDERLFDKISDVPSVMPIRRFQRSQNDVIILGVCSGIAKYLDKDTGIVRLIALLTFLFGWWIVVVYLVTAALMPKEIGSQQISNEKNFIQNKENYKTVFGGLLIIAGLYSMLRLFGLSVCVENIIPYDKFIFSAPVIILGIIFMTRNSSMQVTRESMAPEKFFRSKTDCKLIGVCGGLGKYLNIDSSLLRIIFLLSTFLTLGIFAVLYFLLSLKTSFETEQKIEQ
jgi:phage shock protein C